MFYPQPIVIDIVIIAWIVEFRAFSNINPFPRGKPRVGIVMSHVWSHHFVHFAILTYRGDNDCLVAQTKFADSLSLFQPQNIVQIWFIGRWWRSRASEGSHMQQQKRVKIHSNQNSIWASARKNKCKKNVNYVRGIICLSKCKLRSTSPRQKIRTKYKIFGFEFIIIKWR